MNEHQFELTWASREPASRLIPRVLIRDAATAAVDAFSSLRWIAGLIVCGKVTCDCCSVLFWLQLQGCQPQKDDRTVLVVRRAL